MALAPAGLGPLPAEPSVTVIMAVRDEGSYVAAAVRSICGQTYPSDLLDIVLADGSSTDGTPAIAADAAYGRPITVLANPHRSYPAGLNAAIARSRGEVIVKLDGHAELDPSYVEEAVRSMRDTGAAVVGSRIRTRGRGPTGAAIAFALGHPFVVGGADFRYPGATKVAESVAFGAYRRSVFSAVGTFREDIGRAEDLELHSRIRAAGGTLLLLGATLATYWCRETFVGLMRQYFASGRDMGRNLRWARRYQVVPAVALALEAAWIGAAWARVIPVWVPAAAAAAYAILLTVVATRSLSHGVSPFRTALAVIVVHLGQAFGFLYGLFAR